MLKTVITAEKTKDTGTEKNSGTRVTGTGGGKLRDCCGGQRSLPGGIEPRYRQSRSKTMSDTVSVCRGGKKLNENIERGGEFHSERKCEKVKS